MSNKLSMQIGIIELGISESDAVYLVDTSGDSVYIGDDVAEAKRNLEAVVDALDSYRALHVRNRTAFEGASDD